MATTKARTPHTSRTWAAVSSAATRRARTVGRAARARAARIAKPRRCHARSSKPLSDGGAGSRSGAAGALPVAFIQSEAILLTSSLACLSTSSSSGDVDAVDGDGFVLGESTTPLCCSVARASPSFFSTTATTWLGLGWGLG
eukprot:scaffold29236_cov37-Phaeocystis_antarctica.AAC.2